MGIVVTIQSHWGLVSHDLQSINLKQSSVVAFYRNPRYYWQLLQMVSPGYHQGITGLSHPGEIYYLGEDCGVLCPPVNSWPHHTSPLLLLLNKITLPRSEPLFVCLRELPEIFFHPSNVWQKKSVAQSTKLRMTNWNCATFLWRQLSTVYLMDFMRSMLNITENI